LFPMVGTLTMTFQVERDRRHKTSLSIVTMNT